MNPSQLLTTTEAVDPVFMFIFGICLVMLIGITIAMVWFVIRYRRSRCPQPTSDVDHNLWLEIVWTVIPSILVLAMFWYGWAGYLALRNVPAGAMEVTAVARMWSWSFEYPNGKTASKLFVPVGKPVKVELVSKDVLHSFYLPAFRVKRDTVPGMSGYVWFVASKTGSYDLFCAEYCGVGHSAMITTVEALPEAEFREWYDRAQTATAEHPGRALMENYGCVGCHSLDGSSGAGPTFKGLYGSEITVLRGGKEMTVKADDEFLRESILQPEANLVKGFPPIMPEFADLSEEELKDMVEFIETVQ